MLPATPLPEKALMLLPRLANDNDAEVVAAARALDRQLRSAGWDLHDIVECLKTRPQPSSRLPARPWDETENWGELANWCRFNGTGRLTPKEAQFVADMSRRLVLGGEPSPKQGDWLRAIYAKLKVAAYGC